jgi:hypothetical protein
MFVLDWLFHKQDSFSAEYRREHKKGLFDTLKRRTNDLRNQKKGPTMTPIYLSILARLSSI